MDLFNIRRVILGEGMDFNYLVTYYERIAATKKRLEITAILAELLESCATVENLPDLPKIIYLTQGRLGSEITDWPKFGVAEKMIVQALVKFTGRPEDSIKGLINKKGDVGEAVQAILERRVQKKVSFSLDAFTTSSKQSKSSTPSEPSKSSSSSKSSTPSEPSKQSKLFKSSPSTKTSETSKSSKTSKKFTNTNEKVLEIAHLYRELEKLSLTSGEGSQDSKINIIMGLFRLCNPASAKYVINIILATLRIGLAEMTILDALAITFTGDKANRTQILYAYNIHPDLGKIASLLATKGLKAVETLDVQVGIPIRMMLASRIQYPQIQQKLGGDDFIGEYKYDGERVQVHKTGSKVVLYSRNLKRITKQYPDVVKLVKDNVTAYQAIFEGEIVAMDPFFEKMLPFQVLSTRRRKFDIKKQAQNVKVCLFCFDILFYQPNKSPDPELGNIMSRSLTERRLLLEGLFTPSDQLQLSNSRLLHNTKEMVEYFQEARAQGAEGIMNKKIGEDAIYRAGARGFLWIKLKGLEGAKMTDTIDVVVIGASWGMGRRKGFLSPVFGAVYNPTTAKYEFLTRIGSGFTDEMLDLLTDRMKELELKKRPNNVICSDLPDVWLKPEIIMEIMGDELTQSSKADAGATISEPIGYGLRFPVFQRLREDKSPEQVTSTQEILDFYRDQL